MENKQSEIQTLTEELFEKLGFAVEIVVTENNGAFVVQVKTAEDSEDAPILIGKHAHMLGSLQRIVSAMFFKHFGEPCEILVDVNNYRDGQKERLIGIADNVAQRVLEEDRPARLSSFSPYERKIIHEHINTNYLTLESYSEGEGEMRKLVVGKKGDGGRVTM